MNTTTQRCQEVVAKTLDLCVRNATYRVHMPVAGDRLVCTTHAKSFRRDDGAILITGITSGNTLP